MRQLYYYQKKGVTYAGGETQLTRVRLPDVKMGEARWDSLPAYLLNGPKPYKHLDGVLGVASLELKRLNLDFENNRISWER